VRLCLVHGFTQTGASWEPVAAHLRGAGHDVVTPDAPGHGAKASAPAGLWDGARALADEVGPAVWIGYSMGGRYALHVALAEPAVVTRLVVVSATASSPTGTAATRSSRCRWPVCTYADPAVATSPKNTNTNTSPRPA